MQGRLGDTGLYTFNGLGCVKTTSWRRRRRRRNSRRRRRSVWGESPPLCKHGAMWSSGPVEISSASIFFFFFDTTGARGAAIWRESRLEERTKKKKKKSSSVTDDRLGSSARPEEVLGARSVQLVEGYMYISLVHLELCTLRDPRKGRCTHGSSSTLRVCTRLSTLHHAAGSETRRNAAEGHGARQGRLGSIYLHFPFFSFFFPKRLKQQSTLHLVPLHLHPSHSLSFPFLSCPLPLFFFPPRASTHRKGEGGRKKKKKKKKKLKSRRRWKN